MVIDTPVKAGDGIITTETEAMIFNYTKRRLSYLVKDESLFGEIEFIGSRDYKGKFVVFYKRERSGRLFDFYDGTSPKYRFDFGQLGGEVVTDKLSDIDGPLATAFEKRIAELAGSARRAERVATGE
jgi:hypothetical protein